MARRRDYFVVTKAVQMQWPSNSYRVLRKGNPASL